MVEWGSEYNIDCIDMEYGWTGHDFEYLHHDDVNWTYVTFKCKKCGVKSSVDIDPDNGAMLAKE